MSERPEVDLDALLCALVLAPEVFSRNRFFRLFENRERARVRRRATRVRGIVRQLVGGRAEVIGEAELEDGQVLVRYCVPALGFTRSVALSRLEAASLRYAMHRAKKTYDLPGEDRELVIDALRRLVQHLGLSADVLAAHGGSSNDAPV